LGTDEASNKISEVKMSKILCYCTWEDFTSELFKAVSDEKESHDYPVQFRHISKTPDALGTKSENCLIFELSMPISDEKRWHDQSAQFGYIRIKTLDALETIKSDQFQNWLISKENKYTIERIRDEAKKYGMEEAMEIIFGKK